MDKKKELQKKKSNIIACTKISKRKILWDNSYGEQIPMRALGDTGHSSERDY